MKYFLLLCSYVALLTYMEQMWHGWLAGWRGNYSDIHTGRCFGAKPGEAGDAKKESGAGTTVPLLHAQHTVVNSQHTTR